MSAEATRSKTRSVSTRCSIHLIAGSSIVHCGTFALEIAVWMGFNPIYLLGLDMILGENHFYDNGPGSPEKVRKKQWFLWDTCAEQIKQQRPGIKIYNANPNSMAKGFPVRTPWD